MVNLNVIDTIGSGIKKMFTKQKERFFPMPDYDISDKTRTRIKRRNRGIVNAYLIA